MLNDVFLLRFSLKGNCLQLFFKHKFMKIVAQKYYCYLFSKMLYIFLAHILNTPVSCTYSITSESYYANVVMIESTHSNRYSQKLL